MSHLGQDDKFKERSLRVNQENIVLLLLNRQLPQMPAKPHPETKAAFAVACCSFLAGETIIASFAKSSGSSVRMDSEDETDRPSIRYLNGSMTYNTHA